MRTKNALALMIGSNLRGYIWRALQTPAGSPPRDPATFTIDAPKIPTEQPWQYGCPHTPAHGWCHLLLHHTPVLNRGTCWGWMRLIEMSNCYDRVYNWMRIAHEKGFRILGFAIMPNHVHLLIYTPEDMSINPLLGNAKRLLAYDIVERLKVQGEVKVLERLRSAVRPSDAVRGQEHRVFTTSSDIRECFDRAMIEQKLDYMHANPVSAEWALVADALDYPHSSAGF